MHDNFDVLVKEAKEAVDTIFKGKGHSGFSAKYLRNILINHLNGLPDCAITNNPEDWSEDEHGYGSVLHNKCHRLIKHLDTNEIVLVDKYKFYGNGCYSTSIGSVVVSESEFPLIIEEPILLWLNGRTEEEAIADYEAYEKSQRHFVFHEDILNVEIDPVVISKECNIKYMKRCVIIADIIMSIMDFMRAFSGKRRNGKRILKWSAGRGNATDVRKWIDFVHMFVYESNNGSLEDLVASMGDMVNYWLDGTPEDMYTSYQYMSSRHIGRIDDDDLDLWASVVRQPTDEYIRTCISERKQKDAEYKAEREARLKETGSEEVELDDLEVTDIVVVEGPDTEVPEEE